MSLSDRHRILIAVAVIAASVAAIALSAIGWSYDQKVTAMRSAHRDEVSSIRRDFRKELKKRDEAIDLLKKIDQSIATNCKR